MTKKGNTKKALLMSALSLLLCVSMLVGTTFAWFTDEVTSGTNIIAAGNLDVELYHGKGQEPVDKVTEETLLFTDEDGKEIKNWEPGVVAFTNLKVENVGTLALKYQLSINSTEVNYVKYADGSIYTLADALQVAVIKDGVSGTREEVIAKGEEAGWSDLKSFVLSGELSGEEGSKNSTYGIVVYWKPNEKDDNLFNMNNGKTTSDGEPLRITLGAHLYATQLVHENDSFGPDYDENAWHNGMEVFTAADLKAALANGESVILKSNLELADMLVIPDGADVFINLNGYDLNASYAEGSTTNHIYAITNYGKLTIVGGGTINARGIYNYGDIVLEDATVNTIDGNGGYGIRNYEGASFVMNGGLVATTLEDDDQVDKGGYDATPVRVDEGATFVMNGGEIKNICDFTFAIDNHGEATINAGKVYAVHTTIGNEGTLTINNGEFINDGKDGYSQHVIWANAGTTTINSGIFDGKNSNNGFIICTSEGAVVDIYGGKFLATYSGVLYGKGTISVYGGEFFEDLNDKFVAEGYKCNYANGVYHVKKLNENLVFTAGALKSALNNIETTKIILAGNITLTESLPVAEGAKITIDLYGYSIEGSETATGNFGLININPGAELTINDTIGTGVIALTAGTDRDWNAYSSVISNQRGKLTVNGGTIEHLGGTDMAYAIDNLTNGKNTYAETVINGGVIKSTYRAIRQFLNGTKADNILTINGGTIEGANKSIWMQDPSKNANSGSLTVAAEASLIGDVYLFVTAGSTEWPVNVAIAETVVDDDSELLTANVPEGYVLEVKNGVYVVYKIVDAENALVSNEEVHELNANVQIEDAPIYSSVNATKPVTIDGNGHTVYGEATDIDVFEWSEDGTIPAMSTIFSSDEGALNTVNDITFTGTMSAVMAGNYVNSSANWFNTEFNNVNIIDAEVVSFSAGISPALCIYGNMTMNNCVVTGTTLSELDTDPMWPVYDVAVVNYSNTVINNSVIGSLYMWNQAKVTVADGSEVDTIVIRGNMNATKYGLTIEAGATVGTIDLTNITNVARVNITIEDGATVGAFVDNGVEYATLDEWKNAQ